MSIQNEINRIVNARQDISNYLNSKNVFVPDYVTFEEYPKYIEEVQFSSGAGEESCVTIYNGDKVVGMCLVDDINTSPSFMNYTGNITRISIGNKIANMSDTFYNCQNLTGSPACGENITNMSYAYYNCQNLTGSPACGENITNMSYAYYNCQNLTGSPVCGNNVTDMYYTYANCSNIGSNAYFYSPNVSNVARCFNGKGRTRKLNVYVPTGSKTYLTCVTGTTSTKSLIGSTVRFTNNTINKCSYNAMQNIYIYQVDNVAAARAANND